MWVQPKMLSKVFCKAGLFPAARKILYFIQFKPNHKTLMTTHHTTTAKKPCEGHIKSYTSHAKTAITLTATIRQVPRRKTQMDGKEAPPWICSIHHWLTIYNS